MPKIAGVDGCPSGWIAVVEQTETHNITAHVFLTFSDLTAALDAAVIAIDIPIGLTNHGPRQCDLDARSHLGPKRGTSVFPWSGAPIIPPKRRREGHAIRRALINNAFGPLAFESARNQVLPRHASNDDIADAFAALWTAQRIVKGISRTMPFDPPVDSAGLPMRMMH